MKPFDLNAAKRGEPLVTRDGSTAKFIAHVPEAKEWDRVVFLCRGSVCAAQEDGSSYNGDEPNLDLFMATRKRTVWVNFYIGSKADWFTSKAAADMTEYSGRFGSRAWPVEIEE